MNHPVSNSVTLAKVESKSSREGLFEQLVEALRQSLGAVIQPGLSEAAANPAFLAYAKRHRVSTLIGRLVAKQNAPALQASYTEEVNRNNLNGMIHVSELGKITNQLENDGIHCLCLKGPVLSILAYGGMGPRRVGDLDILIRESDVAKASERLISMGFRLLIPKTIPTGHCFTRYVERSPHFTFCGGTNGRTMVELHWRIFSNPYFFPISFEQAYSTRLEVPVARFRLSTLSEEYFALHLICHGAHHGWERLFWLHDLALLHSQGKLPPRPLLETARKLGLAQLVGQCFLLLKVIYRMEIPVELAEVCAQKESKALADHAFRTCRIFGDHRAPGRFERLRYLLRLRKGNPYRWRVMEQEILQLDKKDFLTAPYAMLPILAALRPITFLKKRKIENPTRQSG